MSNKWLVSSRFPDSVFVPANGWLLFWADADVEQGVLHADFRLSNNGEYLSLASPDGYTLADEIQWDYIAPDTSYGRITDGAEDWVLFIVSTPEASNNGGTIHVLENESTSLLAFPNPAENQVQLSRAVSASIFEITGKHIASLNNERIINATGWLPGVYIDRTSHGSCLRLIKNG